MSSASSRPSTAFQGHRMIASGPLTEVALAAKALAGRGAIGQLLVFDDGRGTVVDLDLRGSPEEIVARIAERHFSPSEAGTPEERGRGRPKLGVVAREVTLLPRHWEWLAAQPGGASAALRRLVDEARHSDGGRSDLRARREAAYRFM